MTQSSDPDRLGRLVGDLRDWLVAEGLEGTTQRDLLDGFCDRLAAAGFPLARLHVAQSSFHPNYGGIGFSWLRSGGITQERYAPSETPRDAWLNSPMYDILASGRPDFRERLTETRGQSRYPLLNQLWADGCTDYFACGAVMQKHDPSQPINPERTPEGVLMSFTCDVPAGYSDTELDMIREVVPYLALALKSAANRRIGEELLQVYLGRDAGSRVLSGAIGRGTLQKINAVILYFDLSGFTRLTEQTPGEDLIGMLNDYYGVVVAEIQKQGGNILKFVGDGVLGMFPQDRLDDPAGAALRAANAAAKAAHRSRISPWPCMRAKSCMAISGPRTGWISPRSDRR